MRAALLIIALSVASGSLVQWKDSIKDDGNSTFPLAK
jgi:hypothetical protein